MLTKVSGIVNGFGGALSYGVVTVYLRASTMPRALFLNYQEPVTRSTIDKNGSTELYLTPNSEIELATGLQKTHYEFLFENQYGGWTEDVVITTSMLTLSINSFFGREESIDPVNRLNRHAADVFNPHRVTIEQVLSADPNFIIPANRVGLPPGVGGISFGEFDFKLTPSTVNLYENTPGVLTIPLPTTLTNLISINGFMDGRRQSKGNAWDIDSSGNNLLIFIATSLNQPERDRYLRSNPEYQITWEINL